MIKHFIKYIFIFVVLISLCFISFRYLYTKTTPCYSEEDGKALPIIMYHHISSDNTKLNNYVISPKQFEEDMLYIKSKGYEPILIKDLLEYVYQGKPIPEKPIIITFDDGNESFYHYAYPILKQHNMKAVLSIVGSFTDTYSKNEDHNINYSYLTWKQINELSKSSYVEIANHTYNLHNNEKGRQGCLPKANENKEEYKNILEKDIKKLQEDITKYTAKTPTTFTYPFGKFNKDTEKIVKDMGFSAILTCEERINIIDINNKDFLYRLGRFNRPHNITTEEFFKNILK